MLCDWQIDCFWFPKAKLIPSIKIHSKACINTIEGSTIKREPKNANDLHGEMSVEKEPWMERDWSSVSSATEESLGRVTQVIFYHIPVTSLPHAIDTIKALQHCQSCIVQFYMFHFQRSVSSLILHLEIENSKFPLEATVYAGFSFPFLVNAYDSKNIPKASNVCIPS